MLLYPLLIVIWYLPRTDAVNWVCEPNTGWLMDADDSPDSCSNPHNGHCSTFSSLFFLALIVTVVTFDRRLCNKTKYDYL